MIRSNALFLKRSTALWASSASSKVAIHSEVSRLLVTIVEKTTIPFDEELVDVATLCVASPQSRLSPPPKIRGRAHPQSLVARIP
jgi:hypothetical protein